MKAQLRQGFRHSWAGERCRGRKASGEGMAQVGCGVKGGIFVRYFKGEHLFKLTAGVMHNRGSAGCEMKRVGHHVSVTRKWVNAYSGSLYFYFKICLKTSE